MSKTKSGLFVIEHCRRRQSSPMEVEGTMISTAATDGSKVTVRIAQDPGQTTGKAQAEVWCASSQATRSRSSARLATKATRAARWHRRPGAGNVRILVTGDPVRDA